MSFKFVENIATTNMVGLVKRVLSIKDVQDYITDLNTEIQLKELNENSLGAVSYTHLTLPTKRIV